LNIEYSEHAKSRMKERSITEAEVVECLERWDTRHTDKKGNPVYRAKLESGRGIKVVVSKEDANFILTAADY